MGHMKKLVGLCVGLMMILIGSVAVATSAQAGETKVIKSKASGSFVSANFDFDHADLSTPAEYINSAGIGNAGKFTAQRLMNLRRTGIPARCPAELQAPELSSRSWTM